MSSVSKKKPPVKQTAPKKTTAPPPKPERDYTLVFLFIVIAIVSYIRYRYITMTLERDEGEYAYIGNLFLHGVPPFKNGYSMKLPGTSLMYALFMFLFGHSNTGIHTGFMVMNAATMYFLYAAFKKLFNPFIGLATAAIYGLMAIGLPFIGFAAHATHCICFYGSIALLLLAGYMKSGKTLTLFLIGLMMGMAFLMKQQAIFLIVYYGLFLLIYLKMEKKLKWPDILKKLVWYGIGVIIPYLIIFFIVVFTGQFRDFWLWTVQYASQYESVKDLSIIEIYLKSSFTPAWAVYDYLWIISLAGMVVLFLTPYSRIQKIFATGFIIASAYVVSSGFYFRPHYYIVILPAIGFLAGILIEFLVKQLLKRLPALKLQQTLLFTLSALVVYMMYDSRQYYFSLRVPQVCNMAYWGNPFSEIPEVAQYIRDHTSDTDKIAVLGSEPEIYFYANRKAATGYLYTYPLVDKQRNNMVMQQQMIDEIEKNKPSYIVFCNISFSWVAQPGVPQKIFQWGNYYTHTYYTPVGFIDFFNDIGWHAFWGDAIKERHVEPAAFMIVFKRNADTARVAAPHS